MINLHQLGCTAQVGVSCRIPVTPSWAWVDRIYPTCWYQIPQVLWNTPILVHKIHSILLQHYISHILFINTPPFFFSKYNQNLFRTYFSFERTMPFVVNKCISNSGPLLLLVPSKYFKHHSGIVGPFDFQGFRKLCPKCNPPKCQHGWRKTHKKKITEQNHFIYTIAIVT